MAGAPRSGAGAGGLAALVAAVSAGAGDAGLARAVAACRALLEAMPASVLVVDAAGGLVFANERAERTGGPLDAGGPALLQLATAFEVLDAHSGRPLPAEERPLRLALQGRPAARSLLLRTEDGTERAMEISAAPLLSPAGEVVAAVAIAVDITERTRAEEQLLRFRSILDSVSEAIVLVDPGDGRFVDANDSASRMLGHSRERLAELTLADVDPALPRDADGWRLYVDALRVAGRPVQFSATYRRSDGAAVPVSVSAQHQSVGDRHYVVVVARDATDQRLAEARLTHQAYHDPLTGLPNRRLLEDRVARAAVQARRHGHRCAVLFVDVDHIKFVNDRLGHPAGDALLQELAARLTGSVRAEDSVARFGGDEFVVLLGRIEDPDDAVRVAEKVLTAVSTPLSLEGEPVAVTASIGISVFPEDGSDAAVLLRHADTAMYAAKAAGRGRYVLYQGAMGTRPPDRAELERQLRRALDRGEFLLDYQPVVEAATGRPVAMEALVRWQHPERGRVNPDAFLPVAVETGLVVPLGEWVLREACRQGRIWHALGHTELAVTVNLSAPQLRDSALVSRVRRALADTGFPARWLVLEVAESTAAADAERFRRVAGELSDLHVEMSIDACGAGYATLPPLRGVPLAAVKLDRVFVGGLGAEADADALLRTTVAFAHEMHVPVVGLGAERAAEVERLRDLGCDRLQGNVIARPQATEEATRWLVEHAGRAPAGQVEPLVDDVLEVALAGDVPGTAALVERVRTTHGVAVLWDGVVAPALRRAEDAGDGDGATADAGRSLVAGVILQAASQGRGGLPWRVTGPLLVLAGLAAGHDALHLTALREVALVAGWRVVVLGPEVGVLEIVSVARRLDAVGVGLVAGPRPDPPRLVRVLRHLRRTLPGVVLFAGWPEGPATGWAAVPGVLTAASAGEALTRLAEARASADPGGMDLTGRVPPS